MKEAKLEKGVLVVEQKYRVNSVQRILDQAKDLKIEFGYPSLEKDIYFDHLSSNAFVLTNEVLRLRSSGSWYDPTELPPTPIQGKTGIAMHSHVLTYKEQRIENAQSVKVREEVKLFVHDVLQCCILLRHLGYGPTLSFEKVRRRAQCAIDISSANAEENGFAIAAGFYTALNSIECSLCLDSLDRDNHFLKIASSVQKDKVDLAARAIEYLAQTWGLNRPESRSYPQIIKDIKS